MVFDIYVTSKAGRAVSAWCSAYQIMPPQSFDSRYTVYGQMPTLSEAFNVLANGWCLTSTARFEWVLGRAKKATLVGFTRGPV